MLLLRHGEKPQSIMIAAERFSIQYKSKLNRLFYNFTNPDTFSPKTNPSRGDMVQSNLTLNQVHLHLGSEDHSKYGRIFSTHLSFPLNIQSTAQCFLVIRPQKNAQNCKFKNRSSRHSTFSKHQTYLYHCIQNILQ